MLEEDGADELVDIGGVGESRKLGGDSAILGELGFEGLAGGDAGLEVWKSRVREVGGKKYYPVSQEWMLVGEGQRIGVLPS